MAINPAIDSIADRLAEEPRSGWLATTMDFVRRRPLGATGGAILGVGSAFFGGKVDLYLQRLMDIFLCFPLIILALALVAILGNSLPNLIVAITIPMIPRCALVIRSRPLAICALLHVAAVLAAGFSTARTILRHSLT